MKDRYLEVTFRKGKPLAGYLYLPRDAGVKSVRTEEAGPGIRVDYAGSGSAIGIEITAPAIVTLQQMNAVLSRLGMAKIGPEDLAPLKAA